MSMRLICENDELRKQLAGSQADNAALVEALEIIAYTSSIPGDGGTQLDHACRWLEKANTARQVLSTPHPGSALIQELEQLRKVRDASENLRFWQSGFGHRETYARLVEELNDVLAQAKAGGDA